MDFSIYIGGILLHVDSTGRTEKTESFLEAWVGSQQERIETTSIKERAEELFEWLTSLRLFAWGDEQQSEFFKFW